ncbi:MAG: hypothetical protein N2Z85_03245 [Patescibacteria group bacterium]|nr:hypothetical protein [Patescibacteria group bacterium]
MKKILRHIINFNIHKNLSILFVIIFILSQSNLFSNDLHNEELIPNISCCTSKDFRCKCCEEETIEFQCNCKIIPNETTDEEISAIIISNLIQKPTIKLIDFEAKIALFINESYKFLTLNQNQTTQQIYIIIKNLLI